MTPVWIPSPSHWIFWIRRWWHNCRPDPASRYSPGWFEQDSCYEQANEWRAQPRSQSSSAISDVTSPVKLVGKSKPPLVTQTARTGLGTRLWRALPNRNQWENVQDHFSTKICFILLLIFLQLGGSWYISNEWVKRGFLMVPPPG